MLFEIINPSDPYTIEANSLEIAAVACCILGEGKYALAELSGDKSGNVPMFMFGGQDDWFMKQFGRTFEQSCNYASQECTDELCCCLASVMIGGADNRRAAEELLKRTGTPQTYLAALYEMHDAKRTSMNDIGRTAWGMADFIKVTFGKEKVH
jgi:hypothetical protein